MVTRNRRSALAAISMGVLLWSTGCATAGESATYKRWDTSYRDPQTSLEAVDPAKDLGTNATLTALIAQAEATNPGLRAAFDRWTAAHEQVPQAKALPDPKISYAYFIKSVETRVGPQRQKFGISQTIPLFGKLGLRGEVAVQATNSAGAQFETVRRDLRYRVTKLWNDYYYLKRAVFITEENVDLVVNLENVALAQYTVGRAPHSAVIRAQVELGRLEDRLRTLRDQRAPILAALNAELNRPADAPIAWPDSIETRPVGLSRADLRAALVRDNSQLAGLAFMKDREAAASRLAGKSTTPDLTIGAEYVDTDEARFPDVPGSGKDAAIAKATINVPLWFGRNRAEKAQAEARLSATRHEHTQLRNRLLAELERVSFEFRDADRRVDLYAHTLLPKAQQALEVTEDAFTAGEADFLDLMDAQRTFLEFELTHERALTDRATRRAQLEQIVGTEIPDTATGGGTPQ